MSKINTEELKKFIEDKRVKADTQQETVLLEGLDQLIFQHENIEIIKGIPEAEQRVVAAIKNKVTLEVQPMLIEDLKLILGIK